MFFSGCVKNACSDVILEIDIIWSRIFLFFYVIAVHFSSFYVNVVQDVVSLKSSVLFFTRVTGEKKYCRNLVISRIKNSRK